MKTEVVIASTYFHKNLQSSNFIPVSPTLVMYFHFEQTGYGMSRLDEKTPDSPYCGVEGLEVEQSSQKSQR